MFASMQAQVSLWRGHNISQGVAGGIRVAEGDAKLPEQRKGLFGKPSCVPKFNGHFMRIVEGRKRGAQTPDIIGCTGCKLKQDQTQFVFQQRSRTFECFDVIRHIRQVFAMGDETGSFEHITESFRGFIPPVEIGLVVEGSVESGVYFYGIEMVSIIRKPFGFGKIFGVEGAAPVVVSPS